MAYDAASRQTAAVNLDSTLATISSFVYGYDRVGNRTSVDEEDGSYTNWTYDCRYQLLGDYRFDAFAYGWCRLTVPQWCELSVDGWNTLPVDATAILDHAFTYDPAGNRILAIDDGALTTSTYDTANRLLTADDEATGVTTYTYDENGNQLTVETPGGELTTNTWDGEDRLVQIEHSDSSITTHAYNCDSLKVDTDDGVDVTRLVLDGKHVLIETDDLGVTEAAYTLNPQPHALVVSQHRDSESHFFHFDGIRNTAELTDDTETVTDEYRFTAWGQSHSSTGTTTNTQQFKGEFSSYRQDPDAVQTDHRPYEPDHARFKSEDPAEAKLNAYLYCSNNPVNRSDPSGLADAERSLVDRAIDFGFDLFDIDPQVGRLAAGLSLEITKREIQSGRTYVSQFENEWRSINQARQQAWANKVNATGDPFVKKVIGPVFNVPNRLSQGGSFLVPLLTDRGLALMQLEAQIGQDVLQENNQGLVDTKNAFLSATASTTYDFSLGLIPGHEVVLRPINVPLQEARIGADILDPLAAYNGDTAGFLTALALEEIAFESLLGLGFSSYRATTLSPSSGIDNAVRLVDDGAVGRTGRGVAPTRNAPDVRTLNPVPDPARPVYKQGHPGKPVVDHVRARAAGGHPTDPSNLHVKPWEWNSRKGAYEGQLLKARQQYIEQGLTPAQADELLAPEWEWLMNDVIPRPMDPNVLDTIPFPGSR